MDADRKRVVEVRLLVLVSVDINHPEFLENVRQRPNTSVGAVVASEVISNLESVSYIEVAITTLL